MDVHFDFKGRVALVTGASSGMGLAAAKAFAEAGAAVVLADVSEQITQVVQEQFTSAGHQAIGIRCDVTDEAQVEAMVAQAVAAYGRLDFAFNNAGIQTPQTDAAEESAEQYDQVNAINARGV